ncbi:UDP-N-acetylglucosamine transferase subunit [Ophidiomyces ophidiicola]|uniref:UDP-N-acetylglucosamine transferase subunit n=1 Tax=Ophidiomyces ophidiicola TaxID=1387563 RepID=UPI0020C2497F|nr:UDP-N-acetylglucosamine transferase subunit [Ophidiomyces ophidiicola]KAI1948019.1 UDP-N-acetylglucosamine transferase subunit [Ophidiomyces ophidiicola]KAI1949701.1 UDP-N-acetylglucosamine transferase subunit [Ophidiomyces ophidiicola]KAI1961637.1 UDP-N-acetylglucosamine transferase subunit [Ophidiomyces ophidiicola]KAI1974225.1 UDP-N-acetylglucosamine transferase subunit [Ophidiomyces ophidiicola]KAI2028557.1 UDP-N-acetylglucosamine transferase subunit [Ophidiomyces ophidiicola]
MSAAAIATAICIVAASATFFVISVVYLTRLTDVSAKHVRSRRGIHLFIVLGSGGHTEEMLSMMRHARLNPGMYSRRTYLVSTGDSFSMKKAAELERELLQLNQFYNQAGKGKVKKRSGNNVMRAKSPSSQGEYTIITIPRARKVHQSLLTAPFSTLHCFWMCLLALRGKHPDQIRSTVAPSQALGYPDLILTNGPGMAVCVIVAARILRCVSRGFITDAPRSGKRGRSRHDKQRRYLRTIFIESWARVKTLSLSGKLVLPIVDRFLVQWSTLEGYQSWNGKKAEYVGQILS